MCQNVALRYFGLIFPSSCENLEKKVGHSQQNPGASRQSRDNFWQVQAEVLINFMECGFLQSLLQLQFEAASERT